ncbi:MAG: GbsR/MarR family transcriptional regulator [Chthoniobacterales bacterium]
MDSTELAPSLSDFQRENILLFVNASKVLSIPRSVGEIFGLLFSTQSPLSLDQVVALLGISKGSASQGLRWLRDVGAVRTVYVDGDRRDHYEAETELRSLILGFLRENVEPHVARGPGYIKRISEAAERLPDESRSFATNRAKKLSRWLQFGSKTLPMFLQLARKF